MSTIEAFITRHPLLTYYTLTFSISWGGMLLAIGGPSGLPGPPEQADRLMGIAFSLLAGPSVAGLPLTGLVSKRAGLRDLFTRLHRWRVGVRWYAVALSVSPLLGRSSAGRGSALPRMMRHHGVFATGVIAGVLWGMWHFLVNFWYSSAISAGIPLPGFLTVYFLTGVAQLTAYRVLMVWVYDRTDSLLVAVLMHASLIVSTTPMLLPAMTGVAFLTWFIVLTVALWLVVLAVAAASQLSRQQIRLRPV